MPAVSPDQFLDALRKSGLMAVDLLDAQLRRSAAEGPPLDAAELAARFVRDGLLTQFQADHLLQGKWRNFVIAGKYKVLGVLGAGGMGQVFLAEHTLMRRRSALKVLPKSLTADPSAVERFLREARAIAALDHPNIVRAYDIDTTDETLHFLVMEYVEGVSLHELVGRWGPVAPAAAANYVAQAARGLQHAHEAGWVHRDVKPANLLLDRAGVVKVLDLGLARLLGERGETLTGRLGDDSVLGTVDYVAPEQAVDSHAVDIRADIYSLGATLYFLLTGRPPFGEGTVAQKLLAHQTKAPRPVHELRQGVPTRLGDIVHRMLAKDPADRYLTPAAVAEALTPWAGASAGGSGSWVYFPPPEDIRPAGTGGALSGAMSSWGGQRGSSSGGGRSKKRAAASPSTGTTAVPASVPTSAEKETAAIVKQAATADTRPVKPLDRSRLAPPAPPRRRRRWPIIAGFTGVVVIAVVGAIALWPKPPAQTTSPTPVTPAVAPTPAPEPAPAPKAEPPGEVRQFIGHQAAVENAAFTPDGRRLVTVGQDTIGRVWDVATGKELQTLTGHTGTIRGVAVLPDGKRAATASFDGTVRLWDLDSGREVGRYQGHVGPVWCVAVEADGRHLISGGADKSVRLWNVETQKEVKRFTRHEGTVTGVAFLADGRRSVAASEDKTVRVWNYQTGHEGKNLNLMQSIRRMAASPDGRWVFLSSGKVVRRWDPDEGATILRIGEPADGVAGLPDGRVLVACHDGTVRLWDVEKARELHSFKGHARAVIAVTAAPDGKHFASGGQDGTARLWRLPEQVAKEPRKK